MYTYIPLLYIVFTTICPYTHTYIIDISVLTELVTTFRDMCPACTNK